MAPKRVLVTGGAGFIGANLVRGLVARGHPVAVLDDLSTGAIENLAGCRGVDFVHGSILDVDALGDAARGVGSIVHLAALPSVPRSIANPERSHEVNATGTVRVLEAARAAGDVHVVLASSSSVYGANPSLPKHEELRPAPLSPYAVSKLAAESYALAYASCYQLPALAFRFFNVFGPLQLPGHAYAAAIPSFLDAALSGRPIPIHGDGQQSRDFTYVGSVVGVLIDAVTRGVTCDGPVNLAFGSRRTLLDVVRTMEEILGRPLETQHGPARPGDVRHSQADQSRLSGLFPDVSAVDFEEGIAETIAWFRNRTG